MEQQRASIDDHNKQYYELTKSKDQCQATRKEQYVKLILALEILEFYKLNIYIYVELQVSARECIAIKFIWSKGGFSESRSKSKIYGW